MFVPTVIILTKIAAVFSIDVQCQLAEVKTILEGCENNVGLNVTTVGGTVIDNHNCDVLLPKQVFYDEPVISYPLADSKKFYSIIMVDPDAPPQIHGEFYIHMLKSNVPGLALSNKEPKPVGVDFRAYKPPMPARGSGAHRYIFLLYEQAEGNSFLPVVPTSRSKFALGVWLHGKNLCGPVAATQFRCQY